MGQRLQREIALHFMAMPARDQRVARREGEDVFPGRAPRRARGSDAKKLAKTLPADGPAGLRRVQELRRVIGEGHRPAAVRVENRQLAHPVPGEHQPPRVLVDHHRGHRPAEPCRVVLAPQPVGRQCQRGEAAVHGPDAARGQRRAERGAVAKPPLRAGDRSSVRGAIRRRQRVAADDVIGRFAVCQHGSRIACVE